MNDQYVKHVGYRNTNEAISGYFSSGTVRFISTKVSELLTDLHPAGVVVPPQRIVDVMNDVYESYRPATGDIFTRYNIASCENYNHVDEMINQVIQIIASNVRDNLLTEQRNSKLTIWSSVYGTFNEHGLRQHPPIKIRNRRPPSDLFQMNY